MDKIISIFIGLLFSFSIGACSNAGHRGDTTTTSPDAALVPGTENTSAGIEVIPTRYEPLLERFRALPDQLVLVNFWATWCKPCVQELPHFRKVINEYKAQGKALHFTMVTLDTKENLESSVLPFLKKNDYQAEHYLLDDNGRMNEWIPKINSQWEGEIPATAFYKNGEQVFFKAGQLSEEELRTLLRQYL